MTEDKARALFAASGKRRDVLEVPEVRPTSVFLRNMIVITRSVTVWSEGSGEWKLRDLSK